MFRYCHILLLVLSVPLHARQRSVYGSVTSEGGEKLVAAIVTLVNQKGSVLKYTVTGEKGEFSLNVPVSADDLWLEVSYFGYLKERKPVEADRNIYDFALKPDPIGLKEVKITGVPVVRQGDTLSYNVESFATGQDRSIGDVLRRMPGIEIGADGAIYHNGEKIQNLYIHGDNLMEGRYGLATKAIRREMIVRVDVIQNHQPVNVLRDKVRSDKTSLNLVLKDENSLKLSGKMMLGGGVPGQVDAAVSPILLNKTIKMVNLAGFNNAGVDYRSDFRKIGSVGLVEEMDTDLPRVSLSQGTVGAPDLPLKNYYFNRSGILNLNSSFTTRKEVQFRVNVQGFTDNNSLTYNAVQENYLENDTVIYREHQWLKNRNRVLNGAFNIMVNKSRYFLNNRLEFSVDKDRDGSQLDFNTLSFQQQLSKKLEGFSNDFNWIPALRNKGIAEFRWFIRKTTDLQVLGIGKGYASELLGNTPRFLDSLNQRVSLPSVSSQAYISYKIPGEVLTQDYKVGYAYESQHLDTRLSYWEHNRNEIYPGDAGNDLRWKRENLYFSPGYQLKYRKFRGQLDLPLAFQKIRYRQEVYHSDKEHFRPVFSPRANLQYNFSVEQRLTVRYSFNRFPGNITNVYKGAVLQNYRTLQANNAELQEKSVHAAGINYEYQKSVTLFFVHIGGFYDGQSTNTLVSTVLEGNIQKTVLLDQRNRVTNRGLNAGMSKYFFGLKVTAGIKGNVTTTAFEQIINGKRLPFTGNNLVLRGNVNKRFFNKINLTWQPVFNGFVSNQNAETQTGLSHSSYRISHDFNFGIEFVKNFLWEITATNSFSRQSNSQEVKYFFLDSKVRYGNQKKKLDVSLEAVNLFNVREYTLYNLYSNQVMINNYILRGRMINLKADFYF